MVSDMAIVSIGACQDFFLVPAVALWIPNRINPADDALGYIGD
jgi:hypothetical protein